MLLILKPKIVWYPDYSLIWVKNFIKKQSKSSKFLAAAAKALTNINNPEVITELLTYNLNKYSISIPYQYYIDSVSILTRDLVCSGSDLLSGSGSNKGDKETRGPGKETIEGSGAVPRTKESVKSAVKSQGAVPASGAVPLQKESATPSEKIAVKSQGAVPASGAVPLQKESATPSEKIAELFRQCEQSFGMLGTTAYEALKDIFVEYPPEWFTQAIQETKNARANGPITYMAKALETWKMQGGPPVNQNSLLPPRQRGASAAGKEPPDYVLKGLVN